MGPKGQERRKTLPLHAEDRERMVRSEMLCEATNGTVQDHEDRIRKIEPRQTRQFMSMSGLWVLLSTVAAFLGIQIK